MANNKEQLIKSIEEFLASDEKCMFITGTHQYEKHIAAMAMLNRCMPNSKILFRINAMQNITGDSFLGKYVSKKPKAGEQFRIGKNIYEADSFNTKNSWSKTSHQFDAAILYPVDAIARKDVKIDCIENLFIHKHISKIFLVSWTDHNNYDYSIFDKYVDRCVVYDAEEEDIEYHKRVLDIVKNKI